MSKNRPIGLLTALLKAAGDGVLTELSRFTADEIAPKIKAYLKTQPQGRQLSQSLWYAKRKGFLSSQEQDGRLAIALTYKGRERLLALERLHLTITKPSQWDGKWRLVTFDIPERRRYARDTFRIALKKIGFVKLEGSIWVTPYECKKELLTIAEALIIGRQVRYFLVEKFDGDEEFKARFNL